MPPNTRPMSQRQNRVARLYEDEGAGASRAISAPARDPLLAEKRLLHLAGRRRPRERVEEAHEARLLVAGEARPDVLDDLVLPERRARPRYDRGDRHFPPVGIRHAEDRRLRDRRVVEQTTLHLDGEDVLAAAL